MAEFTMFVLHPNEQYCDQIAQAFRDYDAEIIIESVIDLREAPTRVEQDKPAVVVVGVDTSNDPALKTIETISHMPGSVGIIVISKEPTQGLLVSCMRAGADEFLEFPVNPDELAKAMGGLFKRKGIVSAHTGKVTAVFSPAGGVGVTSIATNLAGGIASELGSSGASCIIDMNLQFGSVALAMDIREFSHTVADAAQEQDRLDENLIRSFMSEHISGAAVLPGPLNMAELEGVDAWQLRGVIQLCRKVYQYVVLDLPHAIDDVAIVGLDEADEIFLVCDMVLPTIRNVIRALEVFDELEYKRDKLRLIVSRYYESHEVSLDEISQHIGLPIHWLVPYDSRAAIRALNSGQLLDVAQPDSQAAHSLVALAQHVAGVTAKAHTKKRRGFFGWSR